MKSILILTLLVVLSLGFSTSSQAQADDRVKIDFYFESLCPYCQQFIMKSLRTASQTKDFWKICNFNLYPYGNAKRVQNGSSWSFTCQHGPKQCQGNIIESCVVKKYDLYTKALPFIICLESGASSDWTTAGKHCATTVGLNWTEIQQCSTSAEGVKYQVQVAESTEALVPLHTYVPWIVVNDQHTSSAENAITQNMVRYVCSIYKGSEKIDACH